MKKLGPSFSDSVTFGKTKVYKHPTPVSYVEQTKWPIITMFFAIVTAIFLLLARAFYLQVVEGAKNREMADANRIQLVRVRAPRGIIYDRNGVVLVRNVPAFVLKEGINKFKTISSDEALKISTESKSELVLRPVRQFLFGTALSHMLGYLTEINQDELKKDSRVYQPGDLVGRGGIEENYEDKLRGINGKELVEVDALGHKIRSLGKEEPKAGENLTLTIDSRLQQLISDALPPDKKGAVVVSNPETGEILALYSSPSFDPNVFTGSDKVEKIQKILTDSNSPMFDRAISGTYAPGSTFKIITAAAGLETGKINKDSQIEDVGVISIGPFKFPNWYFIQYGKTEGMLDIVKAIKRSNDIFFYKVGEMVGIDELKKMAERFSLDKILGIDLPGEAKGLIPDEAWKQKNISDNWYLGDTYHLAIGQGYLLLTPLQVNFMTNVVASGGKLCRPHLLKTESGTENCYDLGLKKETLSLIKEGMKEACSAGGTGWPFFDFTVNAKRIEVACKTGTAEFGDPQNRTHAWFTMFIPKEEAAEKLADISKAISLTVLVEGAGEGSNVAAPIAKKVLESWLGQ